MKRVFFSRMQPLVDASDHHLHRAILSILASPLFWTLAARIEHRTRLITRVANGNPRLGCYLLAILVFTLGILRDYLFQAALLHQPTVHGSAYPEMKLVAVAMCALGATMVLSSMWVLGITGTYLGDYFGILMEEKATGFPFSVMNNPMARHDFLL